MARLPLAHTELQQCHFTDQLQLYYEADMQWASFFSSLNKQTLFYEQSHEMEHWPLCVVHQKTKTYQVI